MIAILDSVLNDVNTLVANHPPERGGALLGPVGRPVVTKFLHDPQGVTTGASYRASEKLAEAVRELELTSDLELKGILHSHPSQIDHPSAQDVNAFADSLHLNPSMGRFLAPIVTRWPDGQAAAKDAHEIALPAGKIGTFLAFPTSRDVRSSGDIEVHPVAARTIPLTAHVQKLAAHVKSSTPVAVNPTYVAGDVLLVSTITSDDGAELTILASDSYPLIPPTVLVATPGHAVRKADLRWIVTNDDEALVRSADWTALIQPNKHAVYEAEADTQSASPSTDEIREGLRARTEGIIGERVSRESVLLLGLGSVGSMLGEMFVRSGVEHLTLIDFDTVGPESLSRTIYTAADVGSRKTEALSRHLRAVNPGVSLELRTTSFNDLGSADLEQLISRANLVAGCSDDPTAQALLDRSAYQKGIPGIFVGVYAKARGGEVVFTLPKVTSCYRCATSVRHHSPQERPSASYDTGRLVGEPALGPDIQYITTAAAKIGLSLLDVASGDRGPLRDFIWPLLVRRSNFLLLSTVPEYMFFPEVFADVDSQHAYQSVWMSVQGASDCSLCSKIATDGATRKSKPKRRPWNRKPSKV